MNYAVIIGIVQANQAVSLGELKDNTDLLEACDLDEEIETEKVDIVSMVVDCDYTENPLKAVMHLLKENKSRAKHDCLGYVGVECEADGGILELSSDTEDCSLAGAVFTVTDTHRNELVGLHVDQTYILIPLFAFPVCIGSAANGDNQAIMVHETAINR